MRLKHTKISNGNCFYTTRPIYKNGRNTSQDYEQLRYLKGNCHCDSLKNGYGNTLEISTGWNRLRIGESNSTNFVKIKKFWNSLYIGFQDFFHNKLSNMGKINITRPPKTYTFFDKPSFINFLT